MKRIAYGALALMLVMSSGALMAQTIDEIQVYDATGAPASPYDGTSVTVEGWVYVVNNTYNGGTHYIADATGNGINFYQPAAPGLTYGDYVSVTGTLSTFGGEINFYQPTVSYLSSGSEPTPQVMTVDQVMYGLDPGEPNFEDGYENVGRFVEVTAIVESVNGNSNFYLWNAAQDTTIQVYIDSTTGIDLGALVVGQEVTVLSPVVVYNGELELKPRKQSDIDVGGPVIDDIELDDWSPLASESITVSATIVDSDYSVSSADLYFRDNAGDSLGVFTAVAMSNVTGDIWEGTIPGGFTGVQVDFYIEATNTNFVTTTNPGDAPAGWREVGVGFTSIYDVQYRDPSQELQGSDYYNKAVNISGIVTVGTGDAGANSKFLMQDGAGAFNGILVYESSSGIFVLAGDEVEVGGYIDEYFGLTEMAPHSPMAVEILTFDNELPAPVKCRGEVLNDDTLLDGDDIEGEAYESVWVSTFASAVVDTAGADQYNTFMVSDAPGDTLVVDAIVDLFYVAQMDDVVRVTGFMDYSYGARELVPLEDAAIEVLTTTSADDLLPEILPAGGFSAIAPNPFNPKTEIRFVLTRPNQTQLNVYNLRGERVKTLVAERLDTGEHIVTWDGTDMTGQQVSSGTYFARLRIGAEVMQVRKLMLVK